MADTLSEHHGTGLESRPAAPFKERTPSPQPLPYAGGADREEKRQRCWNEGLAAWQEFKKTGLCASSDEMEAWFARLEAGINAEPPACKQAAQDKCTAPS